MNELPKNIDTIQLLKDYWHNHKYQYTIDDFIEDYRISERTAKDLLKDIDYVGISQSLYTKLSSVKRKKFYNRQKLIKELLEKELICCSLNLMKRRIIDGKFYYPYTEAESKKIPADVIIKNFIYFDDIIRGSSGTSDVAQNFNNRTKRSYNNQVKGMDSIEIRIGKGIRRFHALLVEVNPLDVLVAGMLIEEIERNNE